MEKCCRAGEATDDHITRRMRFPCWITKAITTHSEYVMLIAFTWQKWLRKRPPILLYTCMACLIFFPCTRSGIVSAFFSVLFLARTGTRKLSSIKF